MVLSGASVHVTQAPPTSSPHPFIFHLFTHFSNICFVFTHAHPTSHHTLRHLESPLQGSCPSLRLTIGAKVHTTQARTHPHTARTHAAPTQEKKEKKRLRLVGRGLRAPTHLDCLLQSGGSPSASHTVHITQARTHAHSAHPTPHPPTLTACFTEAAWPYGTPFTCVGPVKWLVQPPQLAPLNTPVVTTQAHTRTAHSHPHRRISTDCDQWPHMRTLAPLCIPTAPMKLLLLAGHTHKRVKGVISILHHRRPPDELAQAPT